MDAKWLISVGGGMYNCGGGGGGGGGSDGGVENIEKG